MKAYDIKKLSYRDELARRNRLFFILKLSGFVAAFIFIAGGGLYVLFFTDKLEIKDITISGLQTLDQGLIMREVDKRLGQKKYGYLRIQKNILFFDGDELEASILSANPVLKTIQAKKKFPHKLEIDVLERKPAGIWCADNECRYFDKETNTWGPAARSSGFLFLTIEDERLRDRFEIDRDFLEAIKDVLANLSWLSIKNIIIPQNSFDEFRVYTDRNFYLIFSLDSNIKNQADVLKIFLDDKSKDPPPAGGSNPQYIDLRIDGRIYYK